MSANKEELIPSLVRWGNRQGIAALETLAMGQWDSLIASNGRQLISSSVNGTSFTYSFSPGIDPATIIAAADSAYRILADLTARDVVSEYLSAPPQRRTQATFGGSGTYL